MTTLRTPIVHDSAYALGGTRDRRRKGWDSDPTETRPRLVAFLKRSMGADNYATAIELLNAWGDSLLGLGPSEEESEGGAMDARARDQRGGASLSELFPDSKAPMRV
jgi:hypothetical protein